ncbi:MAG TPA: MopE-related protein, partial [Candidatus Polarisedimenticolia bacterium]|nr:MopE-related protein [Candidatus Polarisedimenticolia bacterium]
LGNGGRYDPATDTWHPLSMTGAPAPRIRHTAVWTGSEMIIWGGGGPTSSQSLDSGGRYNPATDTWLPTSTTGSPRARANHTAVWTGDRMIVWGGGVSSGVADLNTGGRYDPQTDSWAPTSTLEAPSPRHAHTAVWTGVRMVVWGGERYVTNLASGGQYDPTNDSWVATAVSGGPLARHFHTALWTGSLMLVWGGESTTPLSSGGRYDPVPLGVDEDQDGDGFTGCGGDCEDADPSVHPGAMEVCNGVDDNCDGAVDEGGDSLCTSPYVCYAPVCRGTGGCDITGLPDGTSCSDGDSCTTGDMCQSGGCVGTRVPSRLLVTLTPSILTPVNHDLVTVTAFVRFDTCGFGSNPPVLASITSSEPDDAPGPFDGHTVNDIQDASLGTPDYSFQLRAESDRRGSGRIYAVTYTTTDFLGRPATGSATVLVPVKKMGKPTPASQEPKPIPRD